MDNTKNVKALIKKTANIKLFITGVFPYPAINPPATNKITVKTQIIINKTIKNPIIKYLIILYFLVETAPTAFVVFKLSLL